jgi:UDP-N-acetylglucosamine acyltransferase
MIQMIHSSALIDPQAVIGRGVSIGPYCVVEADAVVGNGCRLAAGVVVKQGTRLGDDNEVDEGVVLGGRPQHLARCGPWGGLVIGCGNMIREHVTIHRAMAPDHSTRVGDENLLMVNAHVAHDCHIGNHTIITNNVMLAGHVTVGDYAYLSGGVGVHQFCRIGSHAMVGGQAHIHQDVPPFVTVDGQSTRVVGLNTIGLKRRGFTPDSLQQLKEAYRIMYRRGLPWDQVLSTLQAKFPSGPAAELHPFLCSGQRGFTPERRRSGGMTVPLPRVEFGAATADDWVARRRAG